MTVGESLGLMYVFLFFFLELKPVYVMVDI